jgi:elongation factor 2
MLSAEPILLEPLLKLDVRLPIEQVGIITGIIAQKRGRVLSIEQREHMTHVIGEIPTSESLDLSEIIRGSTGGRAFWGTEFSRWEKIPASLQGSVVKEVRMRKGMSPSPPRPNDLLK